MPIFIFGSKSSFGDDSGHSETTTIILCRFLAKHVLEIALSLQHLRSQQVIKNYLCHSRTEPNKSQLRRICRPEPNAFYYCKVLVRLQLHGAIYRPDSFVMMLRYCSNLKAIRYESMTLNRIVADKSHCVIVA